MATPSNPQTAPDQPLPVQNRKPLTWPCRCLGCHGSFVATDAYAVLCPSCQTEEDALYGVERDARDFDREPPSWSRAAMRERLGVTGDVDE